MTDGTGGTRMEKVIVIREEGVGRDAEPRVRLKGGSPRLIELRQDCDEQDQGQIRYPDSTVSRFGIFNGPIQGR